MNNIAKALAWSAVIIGVALAGRAEWIDADTAQTLTFTLPVLAVITLGNARGCPTRCGARA